MFFFNWRHYGVPLFERAQQILASHARALKVGAGTGALVALLAGHRYAVPGIGSGAQVIEEAKGLAEQFSMSCRFEVGDGSFFGAVLRKAKV